MYITKRQITYSQVDGDLGMNMAGIVHFFQDCAVAHSEALGKKMAELDKMKDAWFLSGWQIEVLQYPKLGEEISVRSWAHGNKGMYGYRNFDILNEQGEQLVRANSIWVFMNLEKMKPEKPTEEAIEGYEIEPALDMEYAARKIKVFEEEYRTVQESALEPIMVKKSFVDLNQHMNNGRYVEEALNYIEGTVKNMRVDYRKAAMLGDILYPVIYRKENVTQVVFLDNSSNPFVIVEVL